MKILYYVTLTNLMIGCTCQKTTCVIDMLPPIDPFCGYCRKEYSHPSGYCEDCYHELLQFYEVSMAPLEKQREAIEKLIGDLRRYGKKLNSIKYDSGMWGLRMGQGLDAKPFSI